jgi:hypothetical protein
MRCNAVLRLRLARQQGYLSHKARVLVLSKQNPFPPLASVAFNEPL